MDKSEIITMHLKGNSNRCIARKLHLSRKTVNKYVREYTSLQEELKSVDETNTDEIHRITEQISARPTYDTKNRHPKKWNKEMDKVLDEILASEAEKNRILGTHKQALTKKQIHQKLRDYGFDIGYTTVCGKVNERTRHPKEAFIAQSHPLGSRFEYDFGEVKLIIAGNLHTLYMAVACTPASGWRFARLYTHQNMAVFVDSHVRFFSALGGVPQEGVYDNMRNVVARFIGRNERELTCELCSLSAYYGFVPNVTNCFSPEEKGSVEASVKACRQAAFATRYEFSSLDEAQRYLEQVIDEMNADTCIDEERACLKPCPPPYEVADIREGVRVDKYSCITVNGTSYSVPDDLVGKKVTVKVYPTEVVSLYKGKTVARHKRPLEEGGMCLDIRHFLDTFRRKPGALSHSKALAFQPRFKALFDAYYSECPREFIDCIFEHKDASTEALYTLLASRKGAHDKDTSTDIQDSVIASTRAQIQRLSNLVMEVGHAS